MRAAALLCALLLPVGAAQADTAVAPRPRPVVAVTGQSEIPAAMVPELAPRAVLVAHGAVRPKARPPAAQRPAEIVQVSSGAPVASGLRPLSRPDNLEAAIIKVAAVRSPSAPAGTGGRKGAVCGVPGIQGQTVAPIKGKVAGCGIDNPVQITAIDGVVLSQPAMMDCPTAIALNTWVQTGLKPAVGRLGGGVKELRVAGHYVCRPRNNQKGAKVSEHGRGKAIDISAITLANGVSISVLKGWRDRQHGAILKTAYKSACGPFGTTLGPGSDGYHEDHLHFDTASYRNGPYCR